MMTISKNINQLREQIAKAAEASGRNPKSLDVIAVSKGQPIQAIEEAFHAGIQNFGENYYQEAYQKLQALKNYPLTWHFIGPIQSNKAKDLAKHFSWVHSIDREKIATLLDAHRSLHLPPLQICIQVNLDNESSKSGVRPNDLIAFIQSIQHLKHLNIRGLMAIPKREKDETLQYKSYYRLTNLLKTVNQQLSLNLDTLSMGMSDDFLPAIKAGANWLRIGRAIFGERDP